MEFRVPGSRGPRAGDPYAHNIIIEVTAEAADRRIEGVGEAAPRGRVLTGDTPPGSWRFLRTALRRLDGAALPVDASPDAARADVAARLDQFRELAASTSKLKTVARPYRGTLAGLEAALLDVAAQASDISVAELLGGQRRPIPVAGVVSTRGPERTFGDRIAACRTRPVIKVVDAAGWEAGLDAVRRAAAVVGTDRPVWLELAEPPEQAGARKLVEALADAVTKGELAPHVIVACDAGSAEVNLGELQRSADTLVAPGSAGPGIVLMADVESREAAQAAVAGGVRGVSLNPQRLGGALATLDVADDLLDHSLVRVGLSTVGHVSGVGERALLELAAALPRLDYCALAVDPDEGMVGIDPPLHSDDDGRAEPGTGHGVGGTVSIVPAVGHLSRYTEVPATPDRLLTFEDKTENVYDLPGLMDFARSDGGLDLANPLLDRAVLERGLNTTRLSQSVLLAEHPDMSEPIGFAIRRTAWTGVSSRTVVDRKDLTKKLLEAAGVAVPRGAMFQPGQADDAVRYAASLGAPVVVKPRAGSHGVGVTTDLRNGDEIRSAIAALGTTTFGNRPFVVEEYIPGEDYRFLVVGDNVVSVVLRRPASVEGDGTSSVVELVMHKNRRRLESPQMRGSLIEFNQNARYWLGRQELTVDSVPAAGQLVWLGSAGNVANGGDSIEVLAETHESLLDLAVRATHAVPGLDHSGVDLVGDHRRSLDEQPAAIIEVNSNPGIDINHFPLFGIPRDVAGEMVVRQCELAGFQPEPPRERLTVRIQVEGRVQGVGYRRWFEKLANARGVVGSIRNVPGGGSVEAVISGTTHDVWILAARAVIGSPRAGVHRVVTTHVAESEVAPLDRFEVTT